MESIPNEIIEKIIDQGNIEEISKICNTSKKYKSVCEKYFIFKIKQIIKTPIQIYYELFQKFYIIDINDKEVNGVNMATIVKKIYNKSRVNETRELEQWRVDQMDTEFIDVDLDADDYGLEELAEYKIKKFGKKGLKITIQHAEYRVEEFIIIYPGDYNAESCKNEIINGVRSYCWGILGERSETRDILIKYNKTEEIIKKIEEINLKIKENKMLLKKGESGWTKEEKDMYKSVVELRSINTQLLNQKTLYLKEIENIKDFE